jgi:hypothetical protein
MNLIIVYLDIIFAWMTGVIPGEKATGIRGLSLFPFPLPFHPAKRLWLHRLLLKKRHLFLQISEEQALRSRTRRDYRLGTESVPFFFYVAFLRWARPDQMAVNVVFYRVISVSSFV